MIEKTLNEWTNLWWPQDDILCLHWGKFDWDLGHWRKSNIQLLQKMKAQMQSMSQVTMGAVGICFLTLEVGEVAIQEMVLRVIHLFQQLNQNYFIVNVSLDPLIQVIVDSCLDNINFTKFSATEEWTDSIPKLTVTKFIPIYSLAMSKCRSLPLECSCNKWLEATCFLTQLAYKG